MQPTLYRQVFPRVNFEIFAVLVFCNICGWASDPENSFMQVPKHFDTFSCRKNRINCQSNQLKWKTTILGKKAHKVKHKGCSESNDSSFIILAQDVRSGCWWYGRSWTFPPTSHYILLTCDKGQERSSLTWKRVMKQRSVTEFFHVGKITLTDIHQHLLNVSGDQTVDVNTVRWWVVCFSSGDRHVKDKPCSGWPWTAAAPQNEEHLDQLISTNVHITTRKLWAEHQFQCIGNNGGNVGISQSLRQVGPPNAHTGTERTPHASLSGPTDPIPSWSWQFPGSHHYWLWGTASPLQARGKIAVHGVNSPSNKKFKMQISTSKVMCTAFGDMKGVILLVFKKSIQTINSDH